MVQIAKEIFEVFQADRDTNYPVGQADRRTSFRAHGSAGGGGGVGDHGFSVVTPEQKHDITDPIEMEKAADALPIEQVAKRWIVASDPDEAVAKIKPYLDAGLNHLVIHAPGQDQLRFLDLFKRDLAPRLRALG